ncbi:uncharacterized protein ccdc92bb isoform X2 [Danio rerio]|uniref:Uncharacterized protein ccdc92bb isoform X2 n=1 Tax=Danio rerio TaxID=7955 RepID=A0AB32TFQ6_DANRE
MGPSVDMCIMILNVARYTEQETAIIDTLKSYFEECEDSLKHISILFTRGEDLEGQTIEEFVQKSAKLQELVDSCEGRCFVIDNKHWKKRLRGYKSNRVQLRKMLKTIDKIEKKTGYNNELLHMVAEEIEKEMKDMKEENLSAEGKRDKAKKSVYEKLWIRLAGVGTGMLIGAFLGIGVAVAAVVALLKAENVTATVKAVCVRAVTTAPIIAGVVLGTSALAGAVEGGLTGWDKADEADSVCEVMTKTAKANLEKARNIYKMAQDLTNDNE